MSKPTIDLKPFNALLNLMGITIGDHAHQCPACANVWRHSDLCFGDESAHRCPKCGTEVWHRYDERA